MTWACFQAASSALPSMVMGVSAQRHSNSVGAGGKVFGVSVAVSPRSPSSSKAKSPSTGKMSTSPCLWGAER